MVMEKCVVCRGPFAPLRWHGLKCKYCATVWHRSCYRSTEDLPEVNSSESDDEMFTQQMTLTVMMNFPWVLQVGTLLLLNHKKL
ncbi:hypothetical protein DPEC_G00156700 [Dallia pectoralis]|uniref:Uncharacterized protein n=1 Tax=Dallia pectoralis TaxID=75939 RepID=A0ACC2GL98_DALPE|nr:hypothetical protein DPEC_G00156700 [Dallia pectoralis]